MSLLYQVLMILNIQLVQMAEYKHNIHATTLLLTKGSRVAYNPFKLETISFTWKW
uniref:Uncharacterized protein n=1 Tax=Myoviridae sp. ctLnO19 TaxID=2825085 RepID=A0A8S5P1C5_9CAUD|nr:MAG TPA: hypothetical protein [Myoviridae sp. ctLnO19]